MSTHYLRDDERSYGFIEDTEISSLAPDKPVVVHVLDGQGNELVQFAEHNKGLIHVHRKTPNRLDGLTQGYDVLDCNKLINITHIGNNHLEIRGTKNPNFNPISQAEIGEMIQNLIK
ncbi:hypothetical protein [Ruminococcus bicirculans (ex Wegman et al. 2014)]|uniref:hypothetical protein n=1 Tax=Ruminococcus bicirculans (ex Wegman et al. 2014) TaxID=1160721 RepID=UPI003670CAEE